jgi:hypothetical protein
MQKELFSFVKKTINFEGKFNILSSYQMVFTHSKTDTTFVQEINTQSNFQMVKKQEGHWKTRQICLFSTGLLSQTVICIKKYFILYKTVFLSGKFTFGSVNKWFVPIQKHDKFVRFLNGQIFRPI